MNKQIWLLVSLLATIADLLAIQWNESFRFFTKPLIVASLIIFFILQASIHNKQLRFFVLAALFFSFGGDVLLMFEQFNEVFFLLGLSSFLIAHIFYVIVFNSLRKQFTRPLNGLLFLPVAVYYILLIFILYDHLNEMRIPVVIYGFVISGMMIMALHVKGRIISGESRILITGALLFVISDSILAFNKFYQPWKGAATLIMLSYGLAQLFIIYSVTRLSLIKKVQN